MITSTLEFNKVLASAPIKANLTTEQRLFLNTYQDIKNKQRGHLPKIYQILNNYPLLPYLTYFDLTSNLNQATEAEIQQFTKQHPTFHLASRLHKKWLISLGKRHHWQQFEKHYQPNKDTSRALTCLHLQAQYHLNQHDKIKLEDTLVAMQKTWLKGQPLTKNCRPIHTLLLSKHRITGAMIWNNIILAMNKRQITFAKHLSKLLSKKEQKIFQAWLKLDKSPTELKYPIRLKMPPKIKTEMVSLSLKRLARKDIKLAMRLFKRYQKSLPFKPTQTNSLKQYLALRMAYRLPDEAKNALYEVNQSHASQDTLRWQLQIALKYSDWPSVLDTYQLVSEETQQKPKWQYWRAKALYETNRIDLANRIFLKLAKQRNFYGFLSADRLKRKYQFNPAPILKPNFAVLIKKYPQLPRIKELIAIDWLLNANREWASLLANVSRDDLQAINYLAHDWKLHNAAIRGAAISKDWNNMTVRFPTPHKTPVMKSSNDNHIDPAWVYGIMRRESAFSSAVRSPVGAVGLMQLMPATARFIGKRKGLNRHIYQNLTQAESNIQLGSAYLAYLYQKYNNRILATAAYNAGPKRIDSWLPSRPLPADQWIDSIQFTETRKYVKAVMEYTIIFQSLLNKKYEHLSSYMTPIQKQHKN